MSNDTQKADQIAFHFYTKLFYVVNSARATAEPRVQPKVDKWFNLETPDSDLFSKEAREKYKSISLSPPPPPLEIQVLLTIPELNTNQVLVYLAPDSSRTLVDPTPRHILLESWVLAFIPHRRGEEDNTDVALPTIYKHGIPLFRSLYTLLRLLPSWKLYKRLRRRTGGSNRNGNLGILLRVRTNSGSDSDSILGFHTPPAAGSLPLLSQTHAFPSVPHPMGTLSLSATYLTTPSFQLDERESLLSSRFLSLDEGPEFVPTLAKNQQRDSISGSPGSLPIRTSLPKSPTPTSSVADRFVLPSRNTSAPTPSTGPGARNTHSRQSSITAVNLTSQPGSTSGISMSSYSRNEGSTSTWSAKEEHSRPPSGLAARLRKESAGAASRGADLPSAPPSPLPIRRPSINPVHPFKSNTLSSGSPLHSPSPSLRQTSPLSSVGPPSLSSRPLSQASPTASRVPPSPMGMGNRPSPPFAPSSLGDKRSITNPEGVGTSEETARVTVPARKRYSSSFGHRYAPSAGGGSEGSAGSAGRGEAGERVGSASFLSTNTDDDEISVFVQDIDSRKPLSGRHRIQQDQEEDASHDRDTSILARTEEKRKEPLQRGSRHSSAASSSGAAAAIAAAGISPPGPMLTSESEVDERLRRMNETFLASLEGLGGGSADGSGNGSTRRRERVRERERTRVTREDSVEARASTEEAELALREREYARMRGSPFSGLSRRRHGSTSTSVSEGVSQGSEEVIGRIELDYERRRSRQ